MKFGLGGQDGGMGNKSNEAYDYKDGGNCKNELDKDEAANSI